MSYDAVQKRMSALLLDNNTREFSLDMLDNVVCDDLDKNEQAVRAAWRSMEENDILRIHLEFRCHNGHRVWMGLVHEPAVFPVSCPTCGAHKDGYRSRSIAVLDPSWGNKRQEAAAVPLTVDVSGRKYVVLQNGQNRTLFEVSADRIERVGDTFDNAGVEVMVEIRKVFDPGTSVILCGSLDEEDEDHVVRSVDAEWGLVHVEAPERYFPISILRFLTWRSHAVTMFQRRYGKEPWFDGVYVDTNHFVAEVKQGQPAPELKLWYGFPVVWRRKPV